MQNSQPLNQQVQLPPPPGVNADQAVLSLMAMAEALRAASPPKYKMAIKCVMASLKVPCSPELTALCSYELGKLLWLYTRNTSMALMHLRNAHKIMCQFGQSLEQARLKTACSIGEILMDERAYREILAVIRPELNDSNKYPSYHAKLLFLFSEAYLRLGEYDRALEVVQSGIAYFHQIKEMILIECYLRLAKCLILSIQMTDQQELGKSVSELGEILQTVQNDEPAINDIRAFCYTIQLCYFLSTGMVKSSKQCLRQLHMTVQSAEQSTSTSSTNLMGLPASMIQFRWLNPEMLTGLAYVLTVLCNIQYSNFERAHRYYGTALKHFEGLRLLMRKSGSWTVVENRHEEFIDRMEMLLFESIAQTQLIQANPQEALTQIVQMVKRVRSSPKLLVDFDAQIHTLLGIYSFYLRLPDNAEKQFKAALKKTSDMELWTIINLSLALVYLFAARESDFYELFDAISPTKLRTQAGSLRAAAFLVQAVHNYLHMRINDCKSQLMDSISISKEEDMARLQSMALLLLSKSFRAKDADVIKAAYEWANKSNDASLVLWANAQIVELQAGNNQAQEAMQLNASVEAQKVKMESARAHCLQSPAHQLVHWAEGNAPSEQELPL